MISAWYSYDNVFIDTSAYLPSYYPQSLLQFLKTCQADTKCCLAVTSPQLPLDRCLRKLLRLGCLRKSSTSSCLNARRVFNLATSAAAVT